MLDIAKNRWSQLGQNLVQAFGRFLEPASSGVRAVENDCLLLRVADCTRRSNCRHCSVLTQSLRAASWVESNWPNVRRDWR